MQSRTASCIIVRHANEDDSEQIYETLKIFWERGLILERTPIDIIETIDRFYIAFFDNTMAGVIAYHDYGSHLKEVRSLVVKDEFSRRGVGSSLLKTLISNIRKDSDPKIFTLTYSPVFFEKNNFVPVDKETLPEKIWKDCINCKDEENCGEIAMVYNN